MEFPEHLRYSEEHEWVDLKGDIATVGITAFAVEELDEVTFVVLPAEKNLPLALKKGDEIGTVESVKAASEIYSPVGGEVIEINRDLEDEEKVKLLNEDPYGRGWIAKIRVSDAGEIDSLMSPADYKSHVGKA